MDQFIKCKVCEKEIELINKKLNLVQCKNCELIFSKTIFSNEDFIETYSKLYSQANSHYLMHFEYEFNKLKKGLKINVGKNRSNLILKNIKENFNILEIGSGIGLVATFLSQNYNKINYLGIELDTSAFEKSQSLGVNAINSDFKSMATLENNYDIIMLWEVIEHLQELKLFLNLSFEKLNRNGKLMFSTPNYDKIKNYKDCGYNIYQDGPPIHLNFFTANNLENILPTIGYSKIRIKKKKRPYFNPKSLTYYKNFIESLFGKYEGTTLYVVATK